MPNREVRFNISANDDASIVFAKAQRALKDLNKEASRRSELGILGRFGEDAKGAKRNPTVEGLEQLSKAAKGAGAIAVVTESVLSLTEAMTAADESNKKLAGTGAFAFWDSLLGKVPGGRFISKQVFGNESLDELQKQVDTKKGLLATRIATSDERFGLRFDARSAVTGSDFEKAQIGVEKGVFTQLNTLEEKIKAQKDLKDELDQSGLFNHTEFKEIAGFIDQTIAGLKEEEDLVRGIGEEQKAQLTQDQIEDHTKRSIQSELKIAEAKGSIRRQALQDAGQSLAAELDLINQNTNAKIEAIRLTAIADEKGKSDEEKAAIDHNAREQRRLVETDALYQKAAAIRKNAIEEENRQRQNQSVFDQLKIDSLQQEIELGATGKELDLKRLQIAQQFQAKRKPLTDIINDENASIADKAKAGLGLQFLGAQEAIAKRAANLGGFTGSTARSDSSPFSTGQAQASQEKTFKVDPKLLEQQAAANKLLENISKGIDTLNTLFGKASPVIKGIFGLQ